MVGVRFRMQGRDRARGLDCVGLVWAAYAAAGVRLMAPVDYPLRGWREARVAAALEASGLRRVCDADARIGDVVLAHLDAGQFHLGIWGGDTVVHAHARLRRVVIAPLGALWRGAERWHWTVGR